MSILVVGLSHHSAPVAVLERAAVSGDDLDKLLHDVHNCGDVAEAMVVSTCNRLEVYADVGRFHGGVSAISELLARHSGVSLHELTEYLYVHYEERAVHHLFTVATGLDSMAIGEAQILGQVRQALRLAQRQRTLGRVLNEFGQRALRTGKRAHAETGIDRAGASLVNIGLDVATRHIGPIEGARCVVVGAGSMSSLAALTLARRGVAEIVVVNRSRGRAQRLVDSVVAEGGAARCAELSELADQLGSADLVVCCTGADGLVVTADMVRRVRERSVERPVFLLDLALPHDVDSRARELAGVAVADLESLRDAAADQQTSDDVDAVRRIVLEEVAAFLSAERAAQVAPTVVALRSMAAEVVESELARLSGRLGEIGEPEREEIAYAMRRVVDKLLHAPMVRVKQLASSPGGSSYAEALRELFDLDPKTPEAVTHADVELGGNDT